MSPVASVDEYLASVPADMRAALERLRSEIKAVVPDAEEGLSYGAPGFKLKGRSLVSYGAAKNHCAFYVQSPAVMEAHETELATYDTSKGTVRFAAGKPLPNDLVTRLVQARVDENEALASKKRKK